ncbi:MAG: hypothetical protein DI570_15260 [Phenylobacterium zucineum]|nr:MAG: hypothetical protein DI570_15260 [Phenylobacterium zucineum]
MSPSSLMFARPPPDLVSIVAGFRQRRAAAEGAGARIALPARPELFLEFYFGERYEVRLDGVASLAPDMVIVGPATRYHTDIRLVGAIDTFTVKLQPTALHHLLRLPGRLLVDAAHDAGAVDRTFRHLRDRLAGAQTFGERLRVAETWFRERLDPPAAADPIGRAARLIRRGRGQVELDRLVASSGLSPRHFRRMFGDAVGVSPKLYGRISRFHGVVSLAARNPRLTNAEVAQRLGYFDQSHMLREAREFGNGLPLLGRARADAMADLSYPEP